ncbi:MAG: hypothetical protein U0232_25940 [Thermomicrobiales bacterium]
MASALAAIGLLILTQVGATGDSLPLVTASPIISLGLSPVLTLTTDLIVGSAPPERAGAASASRDRRRTGRPPRPSRILGSIGVALYRHDLTDNLPAGIPTRVSHRCPRHPRRCRRRRRATPPAPRRTAARRRPQRLHPRHAPHLGLAAIAAISLAVLAATALRHLPAANEQLHAAPTPEPIPFPEYGPLPLELCEEAAD